MEQTNTEKKLNIAIVQAFDKNIREYAEYSRLINALYAYQKGYTYISFEDDLVPVHVSAYYNKILAIQRVFQDSRNFDWVFYLDSDAVVSNFEYKLEDIIVRHFKRDLILTQDLNGSSSGVILVKNTPLMVDFFQEIYTNTKFFHTRTPEESAIAEGCKQPKYRNKVGIENAAFLNAYLNIYPKLIRDSQRVAFWSDQSFILHLFLLPAKDRINMFKSLLAKLNILCIANPEKSSGLEVELPRVGPDPQKGKN